MRIWLDQACIDMLKSRHTLYLSDEGGGRSVDHVCKCGLWFNNFDSYADHVASQAKALALTLIAVDDATRSGVLVENDDEDDVIDAYHRYGSYDDPLGGDPTT